MCVCVCMLNFFDFTMIFWNGLQYVHGVPHCEELTQHLDVFLDVSQIEMSHNLRYVWTSQKTQCVNVVSSGCEENRTDWHDVLYICQSQVQPTPTLWRKQQKRRERAALVSVKCSDWMKPVESVLCYVPKLPVVYVAICSKKTQLTKKKKMFRGRFVDDIGQVWDTTTWTLDRLANGC